MTEMMQVPCKRTRAFYAVLLSTLVLGGCAGVEPTATLKPNAASLSLNVVSASAADPGRVVISQVYGGGGNTGAPLRNDFVELYNAGGTAARLDGWSIQYASATGTGNFSGNVTALRGSIAPGQYYLVQQGGGANGAALPDPDAIGSTLMALGAGKVVLANTTTGLGCNGGSTSCTPEQRVQIVDLVGYGNANFFEGSGPAPTLSNTLAAFRNNDGTQDTNDNRADFVAGAPSPRNGPPWVLSTAPAPGVTDVAIDASIRVTFQERVTVGDGWFAISCAQSGAHDATVTGGPSVFTLDPTSNFADGERCEVTVQASLVKDLSAPAKAMLEDHRWSFIVTTRPACERPYLEVYRIQGSGAATPLANQTVSTRGVVVGDYEGEAALRGFYVQDLRGDEDPRTSDGIFVFNGGNTDEVKLGDVVHVTGRATEFQGQTQISTDASSIAVCGNGASVSPADVTLPFPSATYAERFEGMLVRLPQTLYVTEHFQLGRFGQVVMSSGSRLFQPTNVTTPGPAANAMQAKNDLNRIIIDDAFNNQNPDPILFGRAGNPLSALNTLRGGDKAAGIVGVMTYTWAGNSASGNAYRVRPVNALGADVPKFEAANARPVTPPSVGGTLKVAAMNLLNYFNTFGDNACTNGVGGVPTDCRGAESRVEFERQWPKTVAAIAALDADVLGLIELENDGYASGSAIAHLVDKVNEATAPGTYAFIDVDAATGEKNALGTDAIKVALIYKPAKVTPTGVTAALDSDAFVNGGDAFPRNRPALAQAFVQNSGRGRFVVVVNHLKSKGSACNAPDAGDGQGNCNFVRTRAAQELVKWLANDPTDTGERDVLIVGDLNSYAKENPITALETGGYTNLIAAKLGEHAYSYVFDGQWGYLDYALGSASIGPQVAGVAEWHINADEPSVLDYNTNFKSAGQVVTLYNADQYRVADHDPIVVGLTLRPPPVTYAFRGFLSPVENLPAINDVNAGRAVPVTFGLGGNRGLNVFEPGYPASRRIDCSTGKVLSGAAEIETPGRSDLSYDASTDTYTYVWKTEKGWANSCRELVLRLNDETQHRARFRFVR